MQKGIWLIKGCQKEGTVITIEGYSVSPVIDLANATQIVIKALNKKYSSVIAFFNSSVSTVDAVYHIRGTSVQEMPEKVTIDSATIQAAVALGADSFRITMYPTANTNSVDITQ